MKLYELQIEDNTDEVFAISLVENPAIESDFILKQLLLTKWCARYLIYICKVIIKKTIKSK